MQSSVPFLYLTSFAEDSHTHFLDVQDSFPELRISSDALTTHDNIAAMCEQASPRLKIYYSLNLC